MTIPQEAVPIRLEYSLCELKDRAAARGQQILLFYCSRVIESSTTRGSGDEP